MEEARFRIGQFVIAVAFDEAFGAYRGAVANHGYAVTLSAESEEELKTKFHRLLTGYFGAEAA